MSKSLGNFFTIRDVLQQYHPLALRWFLVNTQYQSPLNYSQRNLDEVCINEEPPPSLVLAMCPEQPLVNASGCPERGVPDLQASNRLYYVYQALDDAASVLSAAGEEGRMAMAEARQQFAQTAGSSSPIFSAAEASLRDDLNTPQALAHLSEPLKALNDLIHTKKVCPN